MEKFAADQFYAIGKFFGWADEWCRCSSELGTVDRESVEHVADNVEAVLAQCTALGMLHPVKIAERFLNDIEQEWEPSISDVQATLNELANAIHIDMENETFLYVSRKEFYNQTLLMGKKVHDRFPQLQEDIVEAGNCLALGCNTACVFHLMRVMETAVQEFGTVLGIGPVFDKSWQYILDQVNKAINALPSKGPHTPALAEVAANLYSVKLAWRNEVMHPKATYSEDQAKEVLQQVRILMGNLVDVLPSPQSSTIN